ncbi:MAG: hypothetical protein ABI129_09170 [Rhodanobacter sp.]
MRTTLFRLIGVFEVAGGLYGVAVMLHRLLPLGSTHDSAIALIGLALFGFTLAAGVQLIDRSERGIRMSLWAQLLQVPLIASPVLSYAFHSGAFVNVFVTLHSTPRLGVDWSLGSQGFILAVAGPSVSRLGINLLALLSWLALRFR